MEGKGRIECGRFVHTFGLSNEIDIAISTAIVTITRSDFLLAHRSASHAPASDLPLTRSFRFRVCPSNAHVIPLLVAIN